MWMQSVIVDPRPDARVADDARLRAEAWVRPTAALTSVERLRLYRDQYLVRMGGALRHDYPILAGFIGCDGFNQLVKTYMEKNASRSYNMQRICDNFPEFLRYAPGLKDRGFCAELARLELAVAAVYNAPLTPALTVERLHAVAPPTWNAARLRPVEGLQLLALSYPANEYYHAVTNNQPPTDTSRRPQWIAVLRINRFEVARLDMREIEFLTLSSLVEGDTIHDAFLIGTAGDREPAAEVVGWITRWCELGLFAEVTVSA